MSQAIYFSDTFFTYLAVGTLVLTGIAASVLVGLLIRDAIKKEIW